jgi:hypothetical protein
MAVTVSKQLIAVQEYAQATCVCLPVEELLTWLRLVTALWALNACLLTAQMHMPASQVAMLHSQQVLLIWMDVIVSKQLIVGQECALLTCVSQLVEA